MKVQIIDDTSVGRSSDLQRQLAGHCRAIGITPQVSVLCDASSDSGIDPDPDLVVYFPDDAPSAGAGHASLAVSLARSGRPVIPVVETAADASTLPPPIDGTNAFVTGRFGGNWFLALSDEVLARAWLRRATRKLFISYKRTDSLAAARQLYDEFDRIGFEVFLDEVTIPRGDGIERSIKGWLNDADAMLLLASPNLDASRWVLDEIAYANAHSIGILGVCWPSPPQAALTLTADQRLDLQSSAFDDLNLPSDARRLTAATLETIVAMVLERRVLAIKSRLDQLLPLGRAALGTVGGVPPVSVGVADLWAPAPVSALLRVMPHRVSPEMLRELVDDGAAGGARSVICFYPEYDPRHPAVVSLRWLFQRPAVVGPLRERDIWAYAGKVKP